MENNEKINEEKRDEEKKDKGAILEIIVVVMLGITALLTAWASWIGSLHGGNQATNYTTSNNLASEGNSEYNAGMQSMMQDMLLWNEISDLQIDIIFAQENNDEVALNQSAYKLYYKLNDNLSETMATAIGWDLSNTSDNQVDTVLAWMEKEEALNSPFTNEDYSTTYFVSANELLEESNKKLENGQKDNSNGDAFGLVTVIYSVILFLLGISSSFQNKKNKFAVVIISFVGFIIATIYMFTLPLPTGFSLLGFF